MCSKHVKASQTALRGASVQPPICRDASVGCLTSRSQSVMPNMAELLDNFKGPDTPRLFKQESDGEVTWPVESSSQQSRTNHKTSSHSRIVKPGHKSARRQSPHLGDVFIKPEPTPRDPRRHQSCITDAIQPSQPIGEQPLTHMQGRKAQSSIKENTTHLSDPQLLVMQAVDVPQLWLAKARLLYASEDIHLPCTVKQWGPLKAFAAKNVPRTHQISSERCAFAEMQALYAASGSYLVHIRDVALTLGVDFSLIRPDLKPQATASVASSNQHRSSFSTHVRTESIDNSILGIPKTDSITDTPPTVDNVLNLKKRRHPDPSHPSSPYTSSTTPLDKSQIRSVSSLTPLMLMQDILPHNTPTDYPHLVEIWRKDLLALDLKYHQHLNLQDTIVSLLAKYDLKHRTAITAFLDTSGTPHFFFLFKSRSTHLHSWSIEREADIITVGIERPRAPHLDTSEQARPSSGQFDLTIKFQVTDHKVVRPWTPVGTSIFPSAPDIAEFLYDTPPSRGADEHAVFVHPCQTPSIPISSLSVFARYLQMSAFTTGVMDAEFQLSYGRKVRYDATLGRVRAVWNYALQGAKTQRDKRARGEYNRPVKSEGMSRVEEGKTSKCSGEDEDDLGRFAVSCASDEEKEKERTEPPRKKIKVEPEDVYPSSDDDE